MTTFPEKMSLVQEQIIEMKRKLGETRLSENSKGAKHSDISCDVKHELAFIQENDYFCQKIKAFNTTQDGYDDDGIRGFMCLRFI